jgi:hypothetical protein
MRLRRAVITGVLSAVVLAGCGAADKPSPQVAVRSAAQSTAQQREGTFRLSLVGSEDDLNKLFNAGAPISDKDRAGLAVLRNGHIEVATGDDKFGLDVKAGDLEHAFELRYVDQKLYARADVDGLAKQFGQSPDTVSGAIGQLAGQEGLGFLSAAAAGKWIVADFSKLSGMFDGLRQQFGGGAGFPTPLPTADPKAIGQLDGLKDAVAKALTEDVAIKELGSDDAGDHYLATLTSLRSFYAKVRPALTQLGALPFGQLPSADEVPDKPASLDVWVKDGRVSRLELDLAQMAPTPPPAGTGRVALRLDIDRDASGVTAPSDAVSVDLAGILGKLASQFSGLLQGAGGLPGGLPHFD